MDPGRQQERAAVTLDEATVRPAVGANVRNHRPLSAPALDMVQVILSGSAAIDGWQHRCRGDPEHRHTAARPRQLKVAEAVLVAVEDQLGTALRDYLAKLLGIGELFMLGRLKGARRMMQQDHPEQAGVASTP